MGLNMGGGLDKDWLADGVVAFTLRLLFFFLSDSIRCMWADGCYGGEPGGGGVSKQGTPG